MTRNPSRLPLLVTLAAGLGMLAWGPIPQPPGYHDFADRSLLLGLVRGRDVLSNAGFAAVALWGLARLLPHRTHPALRVGWPGYLLFLAGLLLTALGSGYYHLEPDNWRLTWDRLPIALACAGLLAAVRAEGRPGANAGRDALLLGLFAVFSVFWWYGTELRGIGDLRPYLLLQALPLLLIPIWQTQSAASLADRRAFGAALGCYALAKVCELYDHPLLAVTGFVSGHTLKHGLATTAAGVIVARLVGRVR